MQLFMYTTFITHRQRLIEAMKGHQRPHAKSLDKYILIYISTICCNKRCTLQVNFLKMIQLFDRVPPNIFKGYHL